MSPVKNQLIDMIDFLSEQEQLLMIEIVKRFIPDDVATPDDLEAIRIADEEYSRGEMTRHEDINWN